MSYQIKLNHIQVTELTLNAGSFNKRITNELETSFGYSTDFTAENPKSFAIIFNLTLRNKEKEFLLEIKSTAHFETDKDIDDQFKDSSFARINAPAIAFPYLRVFISNLTLNAGYDPILLPSFNFIKMAEEENDGKEIE